MQGGAISPLCNRALSAMTCFVEEHDITKGGWPVAPATTLSTEPYSTVVEVFTLESAFNIDICVT